MARPRAKLDRCGEADLVTRRLHTEPPGARRERLLAVQMGLQGELGLNEIAQAVGRSRATIQTWFDTYRQGGVDALLYDARSDNPGRPGRCACGCWMKCVTDCTASPGASGVCPATVRSCPPSRSISGALSRARSAWA